MRSDSKAKKPLSVFLLVMINVIAIDSLRNLSSNAIYGLGIPFYYILAFIGFMVPCALITAELATHHPKTGGAYVWVERAFGAPFGFLTIWLQWIYNVFWYPTILLFIAANIAYLWDPALEQNVFFMLGTVLVLFFLSTLSNCFGMKISGGISTLCAIAGTLLPMILISALGIFWLLNGNMPAIPWSTEAFFPVPWHENNLAFFVIVLFSLFGLEMSAVHAEEVENPQRDYPKALLYSALLIMLTVMTASFAVAIVVPHSSLNIISGLDQALSLFLKALNMDWLFPFALIAIILGGFGGMSAWIIGPTKGLAVAADEGYAPNSWSRRNKKGVPSTILWIQAGLVCIITLFFVYFPSLNTAYWILSNLTSELALLFYIFMFAAAIRLRYNNPEPIPEKAYRIPWGNKGIWIAGGMGMMSCVLALGLSFIPPKDLPLPSVGIYETILILGTVLFSVPPVLYYWWDSRKKRYTIHT